MCVLLHQKKGGIMDKKIMGIDPGSTQSAFVIWDGEEIWEIGLLPNEQLLQKIYKGVDVDIGVIEKVACYGMPVGESIFETVYFSRRLAEAMESTMIEVDRIPRKDVKMHLCHSMRAKDGNISTALADRFAPNEKNKGKGVKKAKGFFYGFANKL